MKSPNTLVYIILVMMVSSCASYKQNIMFEPSDEAELKLQVTKAESNYVIQENDFLQLEVFTNEGERIIDPNRETFRDNPAGSRQMEANVKNYLVDINGIVKFPMVGEIKAEGLTIRQAEAMLQKEYSKFYKDPFVILKFVNKRVVVLGAPGGQVIPLLNENMKLTEVLALSSGINQDAKASNIRVIRDGKHFVANFRKFEDYAQNDIIIFPGDIIYVEPIRRPFLESVRDYSPLLGIVSSITTLIIVILSLN